MLKIFRIGIAISIVITVLSSTILFLNPPAGFSSDDPANPEKRKYNPYVAKASDEGEKAIRGFQIDQKFQVQLWAAEPLLAHPVAFAFDEKNRCFVAESFRIQKGVTDNRGHMHWLADDLNSRTVADRVAIHRKDAKDKFSAQYEKESERIRLLEDTTGSGKANRSTVFADNFHRAEDGLAAGILAREGKVYFTCIPDLWVLQDSKNEGVADSQKSLSTGYGIHVAFYGHDLHGLRVGPDGKLYFSIGDRGLNVVNREGKRLFYPDCGAVMRCNQDGSNLEVIHIGLRNPQELAFDDFGNLFTGDNNSDSGDRARIVEIVEGADSGWRIGYQYGTMMHDKSVPQGNRGPWNYEKLWLPATKEQPAYLFPPIANFTDGPSGFTHYPGIGFSNSYNNHFFLCDFRGSPGGSGIWSFELKPKGSSFELFKPTHFIWNVLATDCDFAPDGAFYLSDWINGWGLSGKGRIYQIKPKDPINQQALNEIKELFAKGFSSYSVEELTKFLSHPHQGIRQEAHFALAKKGEESFASLRKILSNRNSDFVMPKIHALWALAINPRLHSEQIQLIVSALDDSDERIQIQAAKSLANLTQYWNGSTILQNQTKIWLPKLIALLKKNDSPRLQEQIALALYKLGTLPYVNPNETEEIKSKIRNSIMEVIRFHDNKDPYIRHACVMALATVNPIPKQDPKKLIEYSSSEKLAIVLAYRKQVQLGTITIQNAAKQLLPFVQETDNVIFDEVIRAIHDLEITPAYPAIRTLTISNRLSKESILRLLNIRFRLGTREDAQAIATQAGNPESSEMVRLLAIQLLIDWEKPVRLDRLTGLAQVIAPRDVSEIKKVVQGVLSRLFQGSVKIQKQSASLCSKLGITEVGPFLYNLVIDPKTPVETRMEGLITLETLKDKKLAEALEIARNSNEPGLRQIARSIRIRSNPKAVIQELRTVLQTGTLLEKQGSLELLRQAKSKESDEILITYLDNLVNNKLMEELQLDVWLATKDTKNPIIQEKRKQLSTKLEAQKNDLTGYRFLLSGGDASKGKNIFLNNPTAQCQRCHKLEGQGGEVGPALNGIAANQKRQYLLESIVFPNKQIAKGFESVTVTTIDGKTISGIIKENSMKVLKLMTADGKLITIPKEDVESSRSANSAMPEDYSQKLSWSEIRDLVEFLTTLKTPWDESKKGH